MNKHEERLDAGAVIMGYLIVFGGMLAGVGMFIHNFPIVGYVIGGVVGLVIAFLVVSYIVGTIYKELPGKVRGWRGEDG